MSDGDIMDRCMRALGKTAEEQCVISTRTMLRHAFMIYTTLKEEYGIDKAIEIYSKTWEPFLNQAIDKCMAAAGVKEMKDLPSMAKVFEAFYLYFPCTYRTLEATEDRVVGEVTFCPNPLYGPSPSDSYLERADYYRVESKILTKGLCDLFVEMAGLKGTVKTDLEKIICLGDDVCRIVFEKEKG